MGHKLNCWEFKNCGREKGGIMVATLGECPVASAWMHDGTNDGLAGGRVCWQIRQSHHRFASAADICGGATCQSCEFYRRVAHEKKTPAPATLTSTTVA